MLLKLMLKLPVLANCVLEWHYLCVWFLFIYLLILHPFSFIYTYWSPVSSMYSINQFIRNTFHLFFKRLLMIYGLIVWNNDFYQHILLIKHHFNQNFLIQFFLINKKNKNYSLFWVNFLVLFLLGLFLLMTLILLLLLLFLFSLGCLFLLFFGNLSFLFLSKLFFFCLQKLRIDLISKFSLMSG